MALGEILEAQAARDERDRNRVIAPMIPAADATASTAAATSNAASHSAMKLPSPMASVTKSIEARENPIKG